MAAVAQNSPGDVFSPLENLPLDLVQMILFQIPDVLSLRTVVLSAPVFYNAFTGSQKLTVNRVLFNQIHPTVLPEAVITANSSRLAPKKEEDIQEFIFDNLFFRSNHIKDEWTMTEALSLARLHEIVEKLVFFFTPKTHSTSDEVEIELSNSERRRIERALYRYEMICNIFPPDLGDLRDQWEFIFSRFSPWENEQLCSIYEILNDLIYPAFRDVAEHEISWSISRVDYRYSKWNFVLQKLMSLGLETIYQLITVQDYEKRRQLIDKKENYEFDELSAFFMLDMIGLASYPVDDDKMLKNLTEKERAERVQTPFYKDPDPGPRMIWEWAYASEMSSFWVSGERQHALREGCYIFFDESRLKPVLSEDWEDSELRNWESNPLHTEQIEYSEMEKSWDGRERISWSGGSGWWSPDDSSRVIWENGPPRKDEKPPPPPLVPRSLADAKTYLQKLDSLNI